MTKIVISDELQEKLSKITNPIAEAILNVEIDEEAERYINYLGLSKTTEGYISYLTKQKLEKLQPEEYYNAKGRLHKKATGIVTELFKDKYTQREIEIFGDAFRNLFKQEKVDVQQLKLVEGEDIRKWYHENNYTKNNYGSTGNSPIFQSCMRYYSCQDYFDIYCKNLNHVSMAVLFDENEKVKSRTLIWYPEGKKDSKEIFYDRIYAIDKETEDEVQAMLEKLGYINISYKNYITPSRERRVKIELDYGQNDISYFPYVDTMYHIDGKTVYNYSTCSTCKMLDQDGGIDDNRSSCDCCGERADDLHYIEEGRHRRENLCEDCSVYSNQYGSYIYEGNAVELQDGDWVVEDDAIKDYRGEWIYKGDSISLYNGEYASEDDRSVETSEDGENFISGDSNFVCVEGSSEWYNISSSDIEEIDGNYYLIGTDEYESALEQLAEAQN